MKVRHVIWGKVKTGSKRGKLLGFPTVNIALHKQIEEGVYLAEVKIDNRLFSSLTFVGTAKTFGEKTKKVESYILNFKDDVYGKWITVGLFKKIRGNIKFKSEKELILQMKKDLSIANKFFKNNH
jgi:riboflavin kinase/FMN adenylyltransferase